MSIVPKWSPLICLLLHPVLLLCAMSTTMSATITIIVTSAETVHTVIVAMAVTTSQSHYGCGQLPLLMVMILL